eukprot:c23100_g1_i2 orf=74-487(-)
MVSGDYVCINAKFGALLTKCLTSFLPRQIYAKHFVFIYMYATLVTFFTMLWAPRIQSRGRVRGLVTSKGGTVHTVKNMQTCGDCHVAEHVKERWQNFLFPRKVSPFGPIPMDGESFFRQSLCLRQLGKVIHTVCSSI